MKGDTILAAQGLTRTYGTGHGLVRAVDGVDIGFEMATGSLFECINAAMEAEGFAPAS